MKKYLKVLFIIIVILIICFGIILYCFKGKIDLYMAIAKNYIEFTESSPSSGNIGNLKPIDTMEYKDIEYKRVNDVPLTLDIYSAKKQLKGGSPVILYIHGGSWVYGDKSIPDVIAPILESFRQQGFTIISSSYELMRGKEIFEKQVSDVKDTIRWIYKNKDKYGFNTDEIGVIGTSSGAHLSLLATYTDDNKFKGDPNLDNYSSNVKYVVDFFGPTDLSTLDLSKAGWDLNQIIKKTEKNNNKSDIFRKYSPVNYIKKGVPKTLIVHSKDDSVVPYENSLKLYEKNLECGNDVELLTLENSGHNLSEINKKEIADLSFKVLRFVVKNSPL